MRTASLRVAVVTMLVLAHGGAALAGEPAAPSGGPAAPAATGDDAEAQALYEEGLALYNTFDYAGAISTWTQAYGKLPASPANASARNAIVYNIARAQEKAFEQDGELLHLVRAKSLLEVYVQENLDAGGADEADLAKARERIESFAARIEAEQQRIDKERAQRGGAQPKPATPPPAVDRGPRRGTGLVAGGATLLVLGVGTVVGGVTAGVIMGNRAADRIDGLGALGDEERRRREIDRGHRGDTVVLATAISGGIATVAGAVMVAIGAVRMRKHDRVVPRTAMTPWLGRGRAGLSLSIGF
jgi:hypothetical protein